MINPLKEVENNKDIIYDICFNECIGNNFKVALKDKQKLCFDSCFRKTISGFDFLERLDNKK